jgi:regulation of enolase protein 1 (concanavalin A-like superfamily)
VRTTPEGQWETLVIEIPWDAMTWHNPPPGERRDGAVLEVVTGLKTDYWRPTEAEYVHSGHFLGAPFPPESSIELTFRGGFTQQYDQAGLMLYAAPDTWIKAGVEFEDGAPLASTVVTFGRSDWSVAALPPLGPATPVTIRASRSGDELTIRFGLDGAPPRQLMRTCFLPPGVSLLAGPMCCSPTREGLVVRFDPVRLGPSDGQPHGV